MPLDHDIYAWSYVNFTGSFGSVHLVSREKNCIPYWKSILIKSKKNPCALIICSGRIYASSWLGIWGGSESLEFSKFWEGPWIICERLGYVCVNQVHTREPPPTPSAGLLLNLSSILFIHTVYIFILYVGSIFKPIINTIGRFMSYVDAAAAYIRFFMRTCFAFLALTKVYLEH